MTTPTTEVPLVVQSFDNGPPAPVVVAATLPEDNDAKETEAQATTPTVVADEQHVVVVPAANSATEDKTDDGQLVVVVPVADVVDPSGKASSPEAGTLAVPVQSEGMHWRLWLKVFLTSACMGLLFGGSMECGKVTWPVVIRQQFLFERFIMIKMFLSASSASAFYLSVLAFVVPKTLEHARDTYLGCGCGKGYLGVCGGAFILGLGMSLGGACPGMVLVQVGAGVPNSGFTLLGGVIAALVYGGLQPIILPWLSVWSLKWAKLDDFKMFSKAPIWAMSMGVAVVLMAGAGIFEAFFHWNSDRELTTLGLKPWKTAWPPEISGICIGFLQVPAVLFVADTLGSSSSYMTLVSQILNMSMNWQDKWKHLNGYRSGPENWWQVFYVCFAILGAYIASKSTCTYGMAEGVSLVDSFIGGFLMILGSRLASGCTSGHGISGMGFLVLHSIAAVPCMFAGGIVMAFIYNDIDRDAYILRTSMS